MTTAELYKELNYVDHSRNNRKKYARLVLENPELIPKVMTILFKVDDKISTRAAWLLEYVARENLDAILAYLDTFTNNMQKVHLDPAVRPVAKICEYLIEAYYHKEYNAIKTVLNETHKEKITELCFDYMISDQKVAVKAYSMNVLFLLGKEYDWIHPELLLILERDFHSESAAFKARARHLIKRLKK